MTAETILASLHLSLPEVILAVGALLLLMVGVFTGQKPALATWLAIIILAVSGAVLIWATGDGTAYNGVFVSDAFGRFMKVLTLGGSIIAIFMSAGQARLTGIDKFEYPVLLVLATLGMLLMISANDLIA